MTRTSNGTRGLVAWPYGDEGVLKRMPGFSAGLAHFTLRWFRALWRKMNAATERHDF